MCGRPIQDNFMWENSTLRREAYSADPVAYEIWERVSCFGISGNLRPNQSFGRELLRPNSPYKTED